MNALYLSTSGDSTIELPNTLEAEGYGCGVVEIYGKVHHSVAEPLYLCSDICQESIVDNSKLPVLRKIRRSSNAVVKPNIYKVIWLPILRPNITSIRLYICNAQGDIISLGKEKLYCTLLIIPHKNGKPTAMAETFS